MKRKPLKIRIAELPLRGALLDAGRLSAVFGGCANGGEFCGNSSGCCGFVTYPHSDVHCIENKCKWRKQALCRRFARGGGSNPRSAAGSRPIRRANNRESHICASPCG